MHVQGASQRPVTMPTHFTQRHGVCCNEFISKLVFAGHSLSCAHTLKGSGAEAFSMAGRDLRLISLSGQKQSSV